jgi:hypothetical protein
MPLLSNLPSSNALDAERLRTAEISLSRLLQDDEFKSSGRKQASRSSTLEQLKRALADAHRELRPGSSHKPDAGADGTSTLDANGASNRETDRRRACGNADCSSGWTAPWRSRRRPIFEGRWACGGRCILALVHAAITREAGDDRRDGVPVQHHHRIPLGLIMLANGWITHPQLQKALDSQRQSGGGRIGDWLVSECGLEAEVVTKGLSAQWNCPVLTTAGFSPQSMAMALPRVFVEDYGIIPLRIAGSKILYVGFQDNLDASSSFAVGRMSELRTESGVVGETSFQEARKRLLSCSFASLTRTLVPDRASLAEGIASVIELRQPFASRLVRLHQYYWLRIWTEENPRGVGGTLPGDAEGASDYLFVVEDTGLSGFRKASLQR